MAQGQEVLTGQLLLKVSRKVDLAHTSATTFSTCLGFGGAAGSNAQIKGNVMMNPQDAIHDLLQKYAYKHGTGQESALNLRRILRENEIVPAAELVENELTKLHIPFLDPPTQLPCPPTTHPGSPIEDDESMDFGQ